MDFSMYLILLLAPVVSGLAIYTSRSQKLILPVSITLLTGSFLLSLVLLWSDVPISNRFEWLPGLSLGWHLDRLSLSLCALVSFISLLVHVFSHYYMSEDAGVYRYYLKLGFFTSAMLGLLGADHLILFFVFWEMVGFFSYLLIGFWFKDRSKAEAARNAFITNRIADVCLLFGIFSVWLATDTMYFSELSALSLSNLDDSYLLLGGVGILIGAMGKSAQFPFHTWLPHAMAGPTPVSALIHAATMVAAGVYLLVRASIIFPEELLAVTAIVGAFTAMIAAFFALTQFDIKKVLAYSTISQLGYMVMAVGFGAKEMAYFHLWTHAFFKAGLFLASGVVIHSLAHNKLIIDPQDMRNMGGLRKSMPVTYWTYTVCMAALIGLPFFTGFLSKEGILLAGVEWAGAKPDSFRLIIPAIGFFTVFLTAYYMVRQWKMVFLAEKNQSRSAEPWTASMPLLLLAFFSLWFWYSVNPFGHEINLINWIFESGSSSTSGLWLTAISVVLVTAGSSIAFYKEHPHYFKNTGFESWSFNGFFLDKLYQNAVISPYNALSKSSFALDKGIDSILHFIATFTVVFSKLVQQFDRYVIDGLVNFAAYFSRMLAQVFRRQQSFNFQLQLFWMLLTIVVIVWFLVNSSF